MLGAFQTIQCMLKLNVNIVTKYIYKIVIFCQIWYTISQTVVVHLFPNLATFLSSCFFLKMKHLFIYILRLSFLKRILIL